MKKMDHDCYVSIYAMCQEGMTLIKALDVDLDEGISLDPFPSLPPPLDPPPSPPCQFSPSIPLLPFLLQVFFFILIEAMVCHPPKSSFTTTVEKAKLKFRLDSTGIVVMLVILLVNISLYLLILPCVVRLNSFI